jgi:Uma2 family endonuclease
MDYQLPKSTPFLVSDDDMGTNAPVVHQRVIARLTAGLYPLYFPEGRIALEPLPETMLGEESSPTPDLILYDPELEQTRVIVEVCQTKGLKHDLNKVSRILDEAEYGVEEGFVFDYKARRWYKFRQGASAPEQSSFSDVLGLDLHAFL